jgi:hypothetical protein
VRFIEGRLYHRRRREDKKDLHCKYASNTVCGKPYEWWCKGFPPFLLTTYEVDEKGLPKRGENGEILFTRSMKDLQDTCFSGLQAVYEGCPQYQSGEKYLEEWRKRKSRKTPK